ncbi:MAG: hypothetical protein RL685_4265 [Pseudomonadota bacterium]
MRPAVDGVQVEDSGAASAMAGDRLAMAGEIRHPRRSFPSREGKPRGRGRELLPGKQLERGGGRDLLPGKEMRGGGSRFASREGDARRRRCAAAGCEEREVGAKGWTPAGWWMRVMEPDEGRLVSWMKSGSGGRYPIAPTRCPIPWWPVEPRQGLGSVTRARNTARRARCARCRCSPAVPCRSFRSLAEPPSYQAGLLQARPDVRDDLRHDGRLCSLLPVIAGLGETG